MKNLKNTVHTATKIAKECSEKLQIICFEIILKYLLTLQEKQTSNVKSQRILTCVILFILFIIFAIFTLILRDNIFYEKAYESPNDLWRLFWLSSFAFFGLTIRAWRFRNEKDPPLPTYIYYIVNLLVACIVIFSILHLIFSPLNWQYYPISAAIIFFLGFEPWKIRHWFSKLNL